ncbi:MAG: hypothetical protein R2728_10820 [Chitinophagales bacterium]
MKKRAGYLMRVSLVTDGFLRSTEMIDFMDSYKSLISESDRADADVELKKMAMKMLLCVL